jgi:signal transduction histidine kinase
VDVVDHPRAGDPTALRRARGSQESVVRWLALVAPLLLAGFAVTVVRSEDGGASVVRDAALGAGVALFAGGVLVADRVDDRPREATYRAAVASALGGALLLAVLQPDGPGLVGLFVAVVLAVRLAPPAAVIPVLVSAFAVLEITTGLVGGGAGDAAALGVVAAFFGMLILAHRLAAANREAERLLAELAAKQAELARAASLAERQRLAREVHDVLAHALSGLLLQLEGARMLAGDSTDPRLRHVVERAHHLGRSGLDEARRAIGTLRDDELPGPERLPELAARFQEDHGVPCRVAVTGEVRVLEPQTRLAVFRVAQEALTNAGRHARPERVDLTLDYGPAGVGLTVEDTGPAAPATPGAGRAPAPPVRDDADGLPGYGLTGMRERAELLGGTLRTTRTDRGFRVRLELPA